MKVSELMDYIVSNEDTEEVFVKIDGTLYDFTLGVEPEQFDGFDTLYPASISLTPITNE